MKITIKGNDCIVEREEGDPKYHGVRNAAGESRLFHAIKNQLNAQGYDLIKKRMWRDGHMVDERQQYIRSRNLKDPKAFCIRNLRWAIRGAEVDFNEGRVVLSVESLH